MPDAGAESGAIIRLADGENVVPIISPAEYMLRQVQAVFRAYRFRYSSETDLQAGLHTALATAGYEAVREYELDAASRIDLYMPVHRIGIEVKVDGGSGDVMRQLARYAEHPDVDGLLLVTTRPARHRAVPREIAGKPVALFGVVAL